MLCCAPQVNFRFVPLDFRVLYMNVVSLVWNSVLSTLVNDFDQLPAPLDMELPHENGSKHGAAPHCQSLN